MENDDFILATLKNKIIDLISETADADLLDYIYKLLVVESR